MPEVVSAIETTIEVLNPIDLTTLQTVTFSEDVSISERPVYAMRGVARSGARNAPIQMSAGQVTMRRNVDTAAVYDELRRWRYGVLQFSLTSDLRGRRLRHPHLRITKRNADGVTIERRTAYDCKLSDYTLNKPAVGLVGESFTIESLGGIDTPGADHYEPAAPIALFRTGSKTFISSAGTLSTSADSSAAFGLPYVVRRNLLASSQDYTQGAWSFTNASLSANQAIFTITSAVASGLPIGTQILASALMETSANGAHSLQQAFTSVNGTIALSAYVKANGRNWCALAIPGYSTTYFDLVNGAVGASSATSASILSVGGGVYWIGITKTGVPTGSQTATLYLASANSTNSYAGDTTKGILASAIQVDVSGAWTVYQATNASDVDLTSSINGAGLTIEGSGTNLLSANQSDVETDTTGFTTVGSGTTLSRDTTTAFEGTASLKAVCDGVSSPQGFAVYITTLQPNTTYRLQLRLKASAPCTLRFFLHQQSPSNTYGMANINVGTSWQHYSIVIGTPGSVSGNWGLRVDSTSLTPVTFWADALMIEPSAFVTSWVRGGFTRNADVVGIVSPQNELKQSHDLTQGATWIVSGMTQPTKSGDDNTVNFGNTAHYIYQAVTPASVASTTRTAAARLKLGTLSGSVLLRLLDQSGNVIASSTISTSSLSASEYRTFCVTGTAASDDTGIRVQLIGNSGTGTIIVRSLGLVQGSHPGVEVRTPDTAITKPVGGGLDPALVQNGYVEFTILPFSGNATFGSNYAFFGSATDQNQPSLMRITTDSSQYWRVRMNTDKGNFNQGYFFSATNINGINAIDGAPHRVRLQWSNYTLLGVRLMVCSVYVDGVLAFSYDAAAGMGATSWIAPDLTKFISDGSVFAVHSNLVIGYPPLPAGAIAEGRAA